MARADDWARVDYRSRAVAIIGVIATTLVAAVTVTAYVGTRIGLRRVPSRVLTARTHLPRLRDARALTRRAAPPSPPLSAETTKNQHIINLWIAAACCWAYGVVANNGACRRKGI